VADRGEKASTQNEVEGNPQVQQDFAWDVHADTSMVQITKVGPLRPHPENAEDGRQYDRGGTMSRPAKTNAPRNAMMYFMLLS